MPHLSRKCLMHNIDVVVSLKVISITNLENFRTTTSGLLR